MYEKKNDLNIAMENYFTDCLPGSSEELSLCRELMRAAREAVARRQTALEAPVSISAEMITLEVEDVPSGRVFHRSLPLDYYENDNGIAILGEDSSGQTAKIVLLSGRAIEKIKDLQGLGPEEGRCERQ